MKGYAHNPKWDKRKYPLRLVVERYIRRDEYRGIKGEWVLNKLECGHEIPYAKDFYGEIFSVKQRCRFCHEEKIILGVSQ